jgi:hypothetical protein
MKKRQSTKKAKSGVRNDRYARLAMSSLLHSDRSITQLQTVSVLVAKVLRNPAVTQDERDSEHTVLSLLLETVGRYQREVQSYRELVVAVVEDARNLPDSRLSADDALRLMEAVENPAVASQAGTPFDAYRLAVSSSNARPQTL